MHRMTHVSWRGVEHERPFEWLRALRESASGYTELLRESGDPIVAAYRVASARCRASEMSTAVPTLREVHAAARELLGLAGKRNDTSMSIARIRSDCEKAGLLVIGSGQPQFAA